MTGDYTAGIPCVVLDITGFDNYRLISRNPYCGGMTEGTDDIYLLKAGKAAGLKYNAMTVVITPWRSKVAAHLLQCYCNPFAASLQPLCSATATLMQWHCKKLAGLCSRKELITKIIAPMKKACGAIEMETKWA